MLDLPVYWHDHALQYYVYHAYYSLYKTVNDPFRNNNSGYFIDMDL